MVEISSGYHCGGVFFNLYSQAPDVSWNKPFKAHCAVKYDDWLAKVGIHQETECGNLKPLPRSEVVQ